MKADAVRLPHNFCCVSAANNNIVVVVVVVLTPLPNSITLITIIYSQRATFIQLQLPHTHTQLAARPLVHQRRTTFFLRCRGVPSYQNGSSRWRPDISWSPLIWTNHRRHWPRYCTPKQPSRRHLRGVSPSMATNDHQHTQSNSMMPKLYQS